MELFSTDYPAAHSMDTSWFAVDEAGRVAIFDSGEDGAVPLHTLSLGGAAEADPEATQVYERLAPQGDEADGDDEAGPFFHYVNGDYGDPGRYVRTAHVPAQPANVAALPGPLHARMLRLPVDFTTATTLHLADHIGDADAMTWGDTTLRGQPLDPATRQQPRSTGSRWTMVILLALAIALLLGILTAG